MKLSEVADRGVRQLLQLLPRRDLQQLAQTVTNQLLVPDSSAEAIEMIVRFSSCPEQLLRRQRVSRQLLISYVHSHCPRHCSGPAAPQHTKSHLIDAVLSAWQCDKQQQTSPRHSPANTTSSLPSPPNSPVPILSATDFQQSYRDNSSPDCSQQPFPSNSSQHSPLANSYRSSTSNSSEHPCVPDSSSRDFPASQPAPSGLFSPSTNCHPSSSEHYRSMSLAFCRLFFDQLNAARLEPALFWPDARAQLTLCDHSTVVDDRRVQSAAAATHMLNQLASQHRLSLLPHTTDQQQQEEEEGEGLYSARDRFGRHALAVCGSAHHQRCHRVGVFRMAALLAQEEEAEQKASTWRVVLLRLAVVAQPGGDDCRLEMAPQSLLTDHRLALELMCDEAAQQASECQLLLPHT